MYLSKLGTETIRAQYKSQLCAELDELFTEVHTLKINTTGDNIHKITAVKKLVTSINFNKRFQGIVEKHTGIRLKNKWYISGVNYIFAISFDAGNPIQDESGFSDYTRYRSKDPFDKDTQKVVSDIRNSLNSKTGKIENMEYAKKLIGEYATLHICVDTAFNMDLYHEKARYLAPQELTAIVLHELGHVISILEYVCTLQETIYDYIGIPKVSIKSTKDIKKYLDTSKNIAKIVSKIDDKGDRAQVANKGISLVENVLDDKPSINRFQYILFSIITVIIVAIGSVGSIITGFFIGSLILAQDISDAIAWNKKEKVKTSDLKSTARNITDIEFRADAYVAKLGYAAHLANALDKITDNSMLISGKKTPIHKGQTMIPYNFNMAFNKLFVGLHALHDEHGDESKRYEKIKIEIIRNLKSEGIPAEMAEHLLDEYKQLKAVCTAIKIQNKKNNNQIEKLSKIFKFIATCNGLIKFVINGKADEDYDMIIGFAEKLLNNELTISRMRLAKK